MEGTEDGSSPWGGEVCAMLWPYARTTNSPVLTWRMALPSSGMSGTDLAYGATRYGLERKTQW
eukprot:3053341-Rhodomonas_salina.1